VVGGMRIKRWRAFTSSVEEGGPRRNFLLPNPGRDRNANDLKESKLLADDKGALDGKVRNKLGVKGT